MINKFKSFLEQEIYEGVFVSKQLIKRFVVGEQIVFPELEKHKTDLGKIKRVLILASGSSRHAGMVGEYWLEEIAGLNVENELSNEYRFKKIVPEARTLVVAISQSGETKDTIEALKRIKGENVFKLAITNQTNSSLSKLADATIGLEAGEENAIAATKTFLAETIVLIMLSLYLSQKKNFNQEIKELKSLGKKLEHVLLKAVEIGSVARKEKSKDDFILLGRKYEFPIALEGALKFKETSLVHAEGFALGEFAHGPLALVKKDMPVIAIMPMAKSQKADLSVLEKCRAQHGKIIVLSDKVTGVLKKVADEIILLPKSSEKLFSLVAIVGLQLFALNLAVAKKLDPDEAKGLVKAISRD